VSTLRAALKFRVARRFAETTRAAIGEALRIYIARGVDAAALDLRSRSDAPVAVQIASAAIAIAVFVTKSETYANAIAIRG
jgi:hypothetical protein